MPSSSAPSNASQASVQVVVRLRPLNSREQQTNTLPVVACNTQERSVTVLKGTGKHQTKTCYKFDNVFGSFSTQHDVFDATLNSILNDVLNGYESTIFAYGQTGTGKTHTMEGSLEDPDSYGVIPRAAQAIFTTLQSEKEYTRHQVYCSFLEIYNEELCDLLVDSSSSGNNNKPKLTIMEGKNGPFCRGLSEVSVGSAESLLELMRQSQEKRQTGETNMNAQSSRSHCIFTLRVEATRQLQDGSTLSVGGKLHCVDLAGSENAAKANMKGSGDAKQAARELERKNINQSLLTLGRVVSTLKELSQNPKKKNSSVRIPYRDSKLTRILQESLGGRCKTCIIATISPSILSIEETMSTLNYAQAANGIINKPVTTSFMTAGSGGSAPSVASSGDKSDGGAGSVEHWHEMEVRLQYMQSQVDEAQQALARKHIQHQEIVERAEKAEHDRKVAEEKCQEAMEQVSVLETKVEDTTAKLRETETELSQTKVVLGATQETEAKLTQEATALLNPLQSTIADGEAMHEDILTRRQEQVDYKSGTKTYRETALNILQDTTNLLSAMGELQSNHRSILCESNSGYVADHLSHLDNHKALIDELQHTCTEETLRLKANINNDLVPSLQKFASKIKKQLATLVETTESSSESLQTSCQAITEKLNTFEVTITDFERRHVSESDLLLSIIKENFEDSKKSLSEIIKLFKKSMGDAASKRSTARKSLQDTVDSWISTSIASFDSIQTKSTHHVTNLKDTAGVLTSESPTRDAISSLVQQQADAFIQRKQAYILHLEQQNAVLKKQNEELQAAESDQKNRNESMVKNVMEGVQALLHKEMADMSKFQAETFSSLSTGNQASQSSNQDLSKSIVESFDSMHTANGELRQKVSSNFAVQDRVCLDVASTADAFSSSLSTQLQESRSKSEGFATDMADSLAAFEEDDVSSTKRLAEGRSHDFHQHFINCAGPVQGNVSNRLEVIQSNVATLHKTVKEDIVAKVRTTVDLDLMSHQRGAYAGTKSSLEDLDSTVSAGETGLIASAKKNVEVAMELQKSVKQSATDFETSLGAQKTSLQENQKSTEASLEKFQNAVSEKISEANSKIESSEAELNSFAHNVIRFEEAPGNVADHNVPVFSTDLSSTPEASVILQHSTVPLKNNVLKNRTVNVASEDSPSPTSSTAKRPADRSMYASRLGKRTKS